MKIKQNDKVIVIAGKDKGEKGKVIRSFPGANKVIVEGVNIAKKHIKYKNQSKKGEIVEMAMPIDVSNVAIIDEKSGKATRVGYKMEDGKKERIARKGGQKI
jgi:large subunit ribosomal protein L24